MDPLSDVLSLVKLRSYVSGGFDASGDWAAQFGPHDGIKFHAVVTGECFLLARGKGKAFRIASDMAIHIREEPGRATLQ
jgi:hypothetical protein